MSEQSKQREIKSRVWDIELKQFRTNLFIGHGGLLYFSDGGRIGTLETSQFIIQQYTGIKDKNGVEIYEGDIIKCLQSFPEPNEIRSVEWYSLGCGWYLNSPNGKHWYNGIGVYPELNLEVIGNIYETPELLK